MSSFSTFLVKGLPNHHDDHNDDKDDHDSDHDDKDKHDDDHNDKDKHEYDHDDKDDHDDNHFDGVPGAELSQGFIGKPRVGLDLNFRRSTPPPAVTKFHEKKVYEYL